MTKHWAYLDTEFTNLNRYTCKLIGLALIVPGGSEFYVELTDVLEEVTAPISSGRLCCLCWAGRPKTARQIGHE